VTLSLGPDPAGRQTLASSGLSITTAGSMADAAEKIVKLVA
jgi:succinyl-CoA synthetase beta subunit